MKNLATFSLMLALLTGFVMSSASAQESSKDTITRQIYESFQTGQLDQWDTLIAQDVTLYSPGYWGGEGLDVLKNWGGEFLSALKPRIDLVDEFEAVDENGNGRGFITVVLNWKHVEPFFDIKPTGREGTSIETFIFHIENHKITTFSVADNTLDLALYLWDRGSPKAHNVRPDVIKRGVERR